MMRFNKFLRLGNLRTFNTCPVTSPSGQKNYDEFAKVFPTVVKNLTGHEEEEAINKRMVKALQLNVLNGTNCRGMAVVSAYKALENPIKLTNENIKLANILGWCVEINKAFIQTQDDIFDESETRCGVPCWYKNEDVGLTAFNDSVILENYVFRLLKQYFSSHPFYVHIMESFHDVTLKITMSQLLESIFVKEGRANLISTFTPKKYNSLLRYKVEPLIFLLPVNLSLCLAEKFDLNIQQQLEPILREMGDLVQVTNDFLDVFGDCAVTGKIGNDITQGKFTWLITTALEMASASQKRVLIENYGKDNPEAVERVKQIYNELNMPQVFEDHERKKLSYFNAKFQQISAKFPHKMFLEYLMNCIEPTNWKEQGWWAM